MMGMTRQPIAVVVLAAGQGTRMKSRTPKVLHELSGVPLIGHVLATAGALEPEHTVVVLRHEIELIRPVVAELSPSAVVVQQDAIPGTGRALEVALEAIPADFGGAIVVVSGDVPLLDSQTIRAVIEHHLAHRAPATIITTVPKNPVGYGRVVRSATGDVAEIIEESDLADDQHDIGEVNAGCYVFDREAVTRALVSIGSHNAQGEKYLTDAIAAIGQTGGVVQAVRVEDSLLLEGVNDRIQLAALQGALNQMIIRGWQAEGVTINDPASCVIELGVSLAPDVEILPGVQLRGHTTIGPGAVIGPDTTLLHTVVGDDARVLRTHAEGAIIERGASVGPFTYLRPGAVIGQDAKAGAFVEIKNSTLHQGAKVPHLSYIGDADIGEGTNIGAGAITANYDGVAKHRTAVGAHARTGSHTVFVAPVSVGDGAYTAAGAVIRRDVPPGALAVNVAAQKNLEGWVEANREGTPAATAAKAAVGGKKAREKK